MQTSLALALALLSAPAQNDQLTISNVRATYDLLGPNRPDDEILPGDKYLVAFDVEGMKAAPDGKVRFSMAVELKDANGKVLYNQPPTDQELYLTLGGGRLPNSVYIYSPPDDKPGKRSLKLTVVDKATKATQSFTRAFEVLPKDFGIIRLLTTSDPGGSIPAPLSGVVGQYLHVNFYVIAFGRNQGTNQPDLSIEMRVLDDKGKPVLAVPVEGHVTSNVPTDWSMYPMQFHLGLNRPGKFTVELKATDNVANKSAKKIKLPLTVIEQKAPAE
jgi:hypothetical protein